MKYRLVILLCLYANTLVCAYALPDVIDNSAYPTSSSTPVNAMPTIASSNSGMLDLMARVEQLQSEVQQLTGKVEEQANQINELKKQQKSLSTDFDDRIASLENKSNGSSSPSVKSSETPATAPAPVETTQTPSPVVAPNPPEEAKRPIDAEPIPKTNENQKPVDAVESSAKVKAEAPKIPANEKQQFQQAYELLRNGHTDQSIDEFNTYLTQYPNGQLVSNAQYWLGEAYRAKKDNNAATQAFNKVIDNYSGSEKVPDALLKLGLIELDQKNTDKARDYFNRVTANYPETQAARLATKKLQILNAN